MPTVPQPQGILPFTTFKASLEAARAESHVNVPHSRLDGPAAFESVRGYLVDYYSTMSSEHSFVDANGSVFDCVPVEQQHSLRGKPQAAKPVAMPGHHEQPVSPTALANRPLQLHPQLRDSFGNAMAAPKGTIPVRRLTIENLARFGTLQDFFKKSPTGGAVPPRGAVPPQVAASHRWAHASQQVPNVGGASYLNVWDPPIATAADQVFSLSQHWYSANTTAGVVQTAEIGWQVFPQLYGNTMPVLFIYWTADGYNATGCYNLSCNAFVQTSSSFAVGGALSAWSVPGGLQQELFVSYYFTGGNWWVYVNGTGTANALGYYPGSIYGNGPMATGNASQVDYGGETVGTVTFPPMGSGAFAAAGYQQGAYQRQITYLPPGGGPTPATLLPQQATPACYTANLQSFADPWGTTLFFGGPGGNC